MGKCIKSAIFAVGGGGLRTLTSPPSHGILTHTFVFRTFVIQKIQAQNRRGKWKNQISTNLTKSIKGGV